MWDIDMFCGPFHREVEQACGCMGRHPGQRILQRGGLHLCFQPDVPGAPTAASVLLPPMFTLNALGKASKPLRDDSTQCLCVPGHSQVVTFHLQMCS